MINVQAVKQINVIYDVNVVLVMLFTESAISNKDHRIHLSNFIVFVFYICVYCVVQIHIADWSFHQPCMLASEGW